MFGVKFKLHFFRRLILDTRNEICQDFTVNSIKADLLY